MLFSGYQLGVYLLTAPSAILSFDRAAAIRLRVSIRVHERFLLGYGGSRNSTYVVEGPFGRGLTKVFVKQPRFADGNLISSLQNEAYILRLFNAAGLTELDTLLGYDEHQHLLFQRFIEGRPLKQSVQPSGEALTRLARNLGRWFTNVHGITPASLDTTPDLPNQFGYRKPLFWSLSPRDVEQLNHHPLTPEQQDVMRLLTGGEKPLFSIIRRLDWRQDHLIHYDFKFDHLLLADDLAIKGLVDWEMADLGDGHWDVAHIWFELIHPFMFEGQPASDTIRLSVDHLNAFLDGYRSDTPLLPGKLQQFLGVLLLQKHFYGLLGVGLTLTAVRQWLDAAEQLIRCPDDRLPIVVPVGSGAPSLLLSRPKPAPHRPPPDAAVSAGTVDDIQALAWHLATHYPAVGTSSSHLISCVYRWYNGNPGSPAGAATNAEVAQPPEPGEEWLRDEGWWRVEGCSRANSVAIRKNSIRRMAEPGTFVYVRHDARQFMRSGNWSYVRLLSPRYVIRPNQARADRNDFWVRGDQLLPQDFANWIRFYVNLTSNPEGICLFIDTLSAHLNERQLPFELKLRNTLSSYIRTDSAVLFIHRQHFVAVLDTIAFTYGQLRRAGHAFIDGRASPRFAKAVPGLGGIAFGDNPPLPNLSFGMWRARLVAEFVGKLLRNTAFQAQSESEKANQLSRVLHDEFTKAGFDVHALHRNPYPQQQAYPYRDDLFASRLHQPPPLSPPPASSLTYLPRQRFWQAARSIGFVLCREAVWFGDRCTWFGFQKNAIGQGYFQTMTPAELSGLALFLCLLARHCPQEPIFATCLAGLNGQPDAAPAVSQVSIEADMTNHPRTLTLVSATRDYLRLWLVLYEADEDTRFKQFAPLAQELLETFVAKQKPFANGYVETERDPLSTEFNPTLTHGIAALGYLFLSFVDDPAIPVKPLSTYYQLDEATRLRLRQFAPFAS